MEFSWDERSVGPISCHSSCDLYTALREDHPIFVVVIQSHFHHLTSRKRVHVRSCKQSIWFAAVYSICEAKKHIYVEDKMFLKTTYLGMCVQREYEAWVPVPKDSTEGNGGHKVLGELARDIADFRRATEEYNVVRRPQRVVFSTLTSVMQ